MKQILMEVVWAILKIVVVFLVTSFLIMMLVNGILNHYGIKEMTFNVSMAVTLLLFIFTNYLSAAVKSNKTTQK